MPVTGTEAKIADALLWYVGQLVTTPALPVAYPNVKFSPPAASPPDAASPYLDVTFMPNTADSVAIPFDSDNRLDGLLQVSVFWPAGKGMIQPAQVASQVATFFAGGTRIERNGLQVRIDKTPVVGSGLSEPDWFQIPVTVAWYCIAPSS